ncbi:MAG TPA: DUF2726 domain-containing protein [Anaerolineales bacterium]|nr:DUF2726 domain-containing protein [Anaerolineales bacterium]
MADYSTSIPKNGDQTREELPFRLREPFLSAPEAALFRALKKMVAERYVIYSKVSLNELFYIIRPNENVHFFNKIFRKHVDFLLCDSKTFRPAIGVELVRPIGRDETRASDQFMEDLFLTAGLPLVHIPSSDSFEVSDLISLFQLAVTKARQARGQGASDSLEDSVPMCPVCGKMMVLRTHRSGSLMGQLYYGCIDNPKCPGTVAVHV